MSGHLEEKCYYKHLVRASEDFRQKIQTRIKELRSKVNATKLLNVDNTENDESAPQEIEDMLHKTRTWF